MAVTPADINTVIDLINSKKEPYDIPLTHLDAGASLEGWWNAAMACRGRITDTASGVCECFSTLHPMTFEKKVCAPESYLRSDVLGQLTTAANDLPDSILYSQSGIGAGTFEVKAYSTANPSAPPGVYENMNAIFRLDSYGCPETRCRETWTTGYRSYYYCDVRVWVAPSDCSIKVSVVTGYRNECQGGDSGNDFGGTTAWGPGISSRWIARGGQAGCISDYCYHQGCSSAGYPSGPCGSCFGVVCPGEEPSVGQVRYEINFKSNFEV
jgi:hypothetical protein